MATDRRQELLIPSRVVLARPPDEPTGEPPSREPEVLRRFGLAPASAEELHAWFRWLQRRRRASAISCSDGRTDPRRGPDRGLGGAPVDATTTTATSTDATIAIEPSPATRSPRPGGSMLLGGSLHEVVRRLQRDHADRVPVGHGVVPAEDAVRLAAHMSAAFPGTEVAAIELGEQPCVHASRYGLVGYMGFLPARWTRAVELQGGAKSRESAVKDFLDLVFHHRVLSFQHRAWQQGRMAQGFEAARLPARAGCRLDDVTRFLDELLGAPAPRLVHRDALLYYAGLLVSAPRSAATLQQILSDYFAQAVAVSVDDGAGAEEPRVTIRIGPMGLAHYRQFLPTGEAWAVLDELVRLVIGDRVAWAFELGLRRAEAPPLVLRDENDADALQLGWTTWFADEPERPSGPDLVATLGAHAHGEEAGGTW